MKLAVVLGGTIIVGASIGIGSTILDLGGSENVFEAYWLDHAATRPSGDEFLDTVSKPAVPRAEVVGEDEYDFGAMEYNEKRRHTFRIRNAGRAPLMLKEGKTTCVCAVSRISGEDQLAPGETADVTLEWTAKTAGPDPKYAQSAEILTNDPEQPKIILKIKGIISADFRLLPNSLSLGRVTSDKGTTATFRVYGFRTDSVDVSSVQFAEAELAKYYDLAFEPLPDAEVEQEDGARCGLLAKLTVKPGLPLGPIDQTIQLTAKGQKEREVTLDVAVRGTAVGDILIAGKPNSYVSSRSLLKLGDIDRLAGGEATLYLFVKGEHRHQADFSVVTAEPEGYLRVNLSEPQDLNQGKTIKRTLTVTVPPGLGPISRTGPKMDQYGLIVLQTTHPKHKEVRIHVKFSVQ